MTYRLASRTRELQGSPCRGRLRWPGVWPSCSYLPCWRRVPCRRRRGAPSQPSSRSSQPSRFRSWLPPWSPSSIPYLTLSGHRRRRRRRPRSPPSCFVCSTLSKTFFFFFRFTQQRDIIMRPNFSSSQDAYTTLAKKWIQIDRILVFFLDLDLDVCLAADLAKRFSRMALETPSMTMIHELLTWTKKECVWGVGKGRGERVQGCRERIFALAVMK